jgi:hypothetical protein
MCSNIPASPAYGVYISQSSSEKQAIGPGLSKDSPSENV